MKQTAIRLASELDESARDWLRTLFGRELGEDESVVVSISTKNAEPTVAEKDAARERLEALFVRTDARLKAVSIDEFDDALDEALDSVKRGPE